jgi:sugar phosphate isomerase/epimerase
MKIMSSPPLLGVQLGIYGYGPFGRQPEEDLAAVLGVLRSTGYDGAEIMTNVLQRGTDAIRAAFEDQGLKVAALHVFAEDIGDSSKTNNLLDVTLGIDCDRLIISSVVSADFAFYREMAARLNEVGACCTDQGLSLYYHPHSAEYQKFPNDSNVRGIDFLWHETDASLVKFNIDTYWAYRGGASPVQVINDFASRCDYYHIKDGDAVENCPLGEGKVGISDCLKALKDHWPAWIVYEDANPKLPPNELCTVARNCLLQHGIGA